MRVVGDLVELTDRQAFDNEYHGVSNTNIRNLVFNVSKYSQKKTVICFRMAAVILYSGKFSPRCWK